MKALRTIAFSISTRLRQTLRLIRPSSSDHGAVESARHLLNDDQWEALLRLSTFDRKHSLCVYSELMSAGFDDRDVLTAGLLHDIGKFSDKGAIRFADRAMYVLGSTISSGLVRSIAGRWPSSRQAILLDHPRRGAALARHLGCSPATIWLIENHADGLSAQSGDLFNLSQADRAC
ncbi:hypothetical protein BH23CHL5_BH23CHL5_06660 [soil metagenome]